MAIKRNRFNIPCPSEIREKNSAQNLQDMALQILRLRRSGQDRMVAPACAPSIWRSCTFASARETSMSANASGSTWCEQEQVIKKRRPEAFHGAQVDLLVPAQRAGTAARVLVNAGGSRMIAP